MSHNAEMILDQVDVVKLDINLWTSSKKLRTEDLVLANGSKLPPEDLAYLGTKKTIDPDALKDFNRIKKEAERICLKTGTRFLGGFANPRSEIPRITQELDELAKTFVAAKEKFLSTYDQSTKDWINRHTEFGDAIRRAIEPVDSVRAKLHFDYVVFRVTAPQPEVVLPETSMAATDSLNRRTNSMSDQLFHEIAQDANQLVERSFVGKDSVTGRVLNAFRRMRDKLDSLGFLDHRCMPIVDEIDSVLKTIPANGPYNGSTFHCLFRLGMLLSDPDKIKRHGSLLQSPSIVPDDSETEVESEPIALEVVPEVVIPSQEIVQSSLPAAAIATETSALGEQPAASLDNDDDIPGFDDFLAGYRPAQDVAGNAESSAAIEIQPAPVKGTVFEIVGVGDFLESVMETVNTATQSVSSIPVESVKDDLNESANNEVEELVATDVATDFWF